MDLSLLQDILVLLGFSVIIVFLLQRIKLPSILGFLVTGILIGPYGLSLVQAVEQVETISQIGVILLLFVIGLEMSIKQLASIKKTVFIGGFLQVALTVFITAAIYHFIGTAWNKAVFMGFLFSLSSTAIVLKVLQDRNEISQEHGRNALAILIFQDIIVVPMMLVTPIMAGNSTDITGSIIGLLLKSLVVVVLMIVSARYIIPKVMYLIAKTRSKELFLITTMTICFAVADLTALAGLSLALGAFLAGLIISESEYSHQATSIILPFRELFTSFFFISVGMLMNISFFLHHVGIVLLLVVALFLVKFLSAAIAMAVLKYSARTVLLTAFSIFQVGEFAFIMATVGISNGLLSNHVYQYFLAISICSMLATPFVMMFSNRLSDKILGIKILKKMKHSSRPRHSYNSGFPVEYENHLIIVGFGITGRGLARAAQYSKIPYVILETNAVTVEKEKAKGTPIIFGDASENHILNYVNVSHARSVVIAISNLAASRNVIRSIRSISHTAHIIVRTKYVRQIDELKDLGADEVVPEELEASIEIFSRILHDFLIPEDEIQTFQEIIRSDNYHLFQDRSQLPTTFKISQIPDFQITSFRVYRDSGSPVGRTIKDLDLRAKYGISIIAISRNNKVISPIHSDDKILQNDLLYLHGDRFNIEQFRRAIS